MTIKKILYKYLFPILQTLGWIGINIISYYINGRLLLIPTNVVFILLIISSYANCRK